MNKLHGGILKTLFILPILFFFSITSHAQELWGGTRYDMTAAEVILRQPNATKPIDGNSIASGAKEILRLEDIDISTAKFKAGFYFLDDKLKQVMLSLKTPSTFSQAKLIYDDIAVLLRSKYGKEIESSESKGLIKISQMTWMSNKTNITIIVVGSNESARLNIAYQTRVADSASKL